MNFKEVKIEVWNTDVLVFWNCTQKEAAAYLKDKYNNFPDVILKNMEEERACKGVCFTDPNSAGSVIWLGDAPETLKGKLTLFHESIHASLRVMKHWQINVNDETEEVLTSMATFINKKVLEE